MRNVPPTATIITPVPSAERAPMLLRTTVTTNVVKPSRKSIMRAAALRPTGAGADGKRFCRDGVALQQTGRSLPNRCPRAKRHYGRSLTSSPVPQPRPLSRIQQVRGPGRSRTSRPRSETAHARTVRPPRTSRGQGRSRAGAGTLTGKCRSRSTRVAAAERYRGAGAIPPTGNVLDGSGGDAARSVDNRWPLVERQGDDSVVAQLLLPDSWPAAGCQVEQIP